MYIHYIALDSTHEGNFVIDKHSGIIDYLFIYIKTPCLFLIEGNSYTIKDPSVILITDRVPHKYFSTSNVYIDDYMHFSPTSPYEFESKLTFPVNIPITISDDMWISPLFRELDFENKNPTHLSDELLTNLIHQLNLRVGQQWHLLQKNEKDFPHYDDLHRIRETIFSHPEKHWQINMLADKAHLSPSYFQVLYKQAFGSTCISDVISARVTAAKELLEVSNDSVSSISEQLGYSQVYHFIRQFKKITGMTPGSYRKKVV